jgi:hypothetical protein
MRPPPPQQISAAAVRLRERFRAAEQCIAAETVSSQEGLNFVGLLIWTQVARAQILQPPEKPFHLSPVPLCLFGQPDYLLMLLCL